VTLFDMVPSGSALLWIGGIALASSIAFGGVQTVRLANARTALATEKRDRADDLAKLQAAAREQADRFRATEHDWQELQRENELMARKARDLASLDAAAAGAAGGRLHDRAAALAAACRGPARGAAAVAAGPAASAPGDLLADVLGRLDAAGRLVAAYADTAAINGEQCAADYQTLRRTTSPTKDPS
jgi:hypothetical protein